MHVLVTGASSFIGRHAVLALSRADIRVTSTFRSDTAAIDQLKTAAPRANFVRVDLAQENSFAALPSAVDAIVHIAGISTAPGVGIDDMLSCNVAGTRHLLSYARRVGVARVIFTSTLSIHGDIDEPLVTEATPVRAPGTYGASKYLAERLFAAEAHWLPCAAVRLPGVLGDGAHRAWIPTLLDQINSHKDVVAYNLQAAFNNAAHVDDLNALLLNMLKGQWTGFHAFPVGAAGQISIGALVELLISVTGSRSRVTAGETQKPPFTISSDYAAKNFGYSPMNIELMLRKYVGASSKPVPESAG